MARSSEAFGNDAARRHDSADIEQLMADDQHPHSSQAAHAHDHSEVPARDRHGAHASHDMPAGHDKHAGHSVEMFRR
jgi:hypothetical protein